MNLPETGRKLMIMPREVKKQILFDRMRGLVNVNFVTIERLYDELTFKITEEMIWKVMKKENVNPDIAETYLNALKLCFFMIDSIISSPNLKITKLKEIKNFLFSEGLIGKNDNINYFRSVNRKVTGYDNLPKHFIKALALIGEDFENDLRIKRGNRPLSCYEFVSGERETEYVCFDIAEKLAEGIDINKIKLAGVDKGYHFILRKIFDLYHIPIDIPNRESLYDLDLVKKILMAIRTGAFNTSSEEAEKLKTEQPDVYTRLINIMNRYVGISDDGDVYELIKRDLKRSYINRKTINDVKVIDLDTYLPRDDEFVYILGFRQGVFPRIFKDEDFLSDKEKELLSLSPTSELNLFAKINLINKLSSIKHLFISYSRFSAFDEFMPSLFLKEFGIAMKKEENLKKIKYIYSDDYNKYVLAKQADFFARYKKCEPETGDLVTTYPENRYGSFDCRFNGLPKDYRYRDSVLRISPSDIERFYRCPFRYYLDKIIKVDEFERSFETVIGNIFHRVLERAEKEKEKFDFDRCYDQSIAVGKAKTDKETIIETAGEEVILKYCLKPILAAVIAEIGIQNETINYKKIKTEKKTTIDQSFFNVKADCDFILGGKTDKIYLSDNEKAVAVVDYKTGSADYKKFGNPSDGINLQLPVYAMLLHKAEKKEIGGFYYQQVCNEHGKFALKGFTNDLPGNNFINVTVGKDSPSGRTVENFYIKKTGKGEESANIRRINNRQLERLFALAERKIIEAVNKINSGEFAVFPYRLKDGKECDYCGYKDICFNRKHYHRLKTESLKDYLGKKE